MTSFQPSPIMLPMPRGNQYVSVKLDYLNTILRPNATVLVSRKYADMLELDSDEISFKEGQRGTDLHTAISKRSKQPDIDITSNIDIE